MWLVSEASGFGEVGAMLSDREKLILHFVAFISSRDVNDPRIDKMMYKVIHSRCRSIASEDVMDIVEEITEEMLAGKIMFEQHMRDLKWSRTGERPNKNTNWRDMR